MCGGIFVEIKTKETQEKLTGGSTKKLVRSVLMNMSCPPGGNHRPWE